MRVVTPPTKPASEPLDVDALVARAMRGDEGAWRELIERYARRVYALLKSKVGRDDIAEEITQSVFVTLSEQLAHGRYTEIGRFESWLFRIALNRLRDERRRNRRFQQWWKSAARMQAPTHTPPSLSKTDATLAGTTRSHGLEFDCDDVGRLRLALNRLSDADREIISLRHHASLEFKVIADMLGEPLGTVLARHHRALKKLRSMLAPAEEPREHHEDTSP